jgi:hypothetical protein
MVNTGIRERGRNFPFPLYYMGIGGQFFHLPMNWEVTPALPFVQARPPRIDSKISSKKTTRSNPTTGLPVAAIS